MKRLFSKRSGFTLVEIIIAFGIFAIMASMIVQMLNLMVQRKVRNRQFEDNLSVQEEQFIARPKDMNYTATTADGQLSLPFKDKAGTDLTVDPIDYQLKNWQKKGDDDPDDYYKNGINYFVGNYTYDIDYEGSEHLGEEDPDSDDDDGSSTGGSTQMSRFDTRLTGTKGIDSIRIDVTKSDDWSNTPGNEKFSYNVTVTVSDDGVDDSIQSHSQVSLFFAENKPNGSKLKVVSVNNRAKDQETLKKVKKCGDNGVNVHCEQSTGFGGSSVSFVVELDKGVEVSDIAFGSNAEGGNTYGPFTVEDKNGNEVTYVNIFGAYQKKTTTTGGDEGTGDKTEE